MITPIPHATPAQAADQSTAARQPSLQPTPPPAATDTVTLSAAATVRQELAETSVQTAREASLGDIQAKNLLVREAADKKLGL
jgi:hypothetical protein